MKKAVFFVGMFFAVSSILVSQDSYKMSVDKEFKLPQAGQYLTAEDVMNIKAALDASAWMNDMYRKENESLRASYKQISDAYSTILSRLDEFKRDSGLVLYRAGRVAIFGPSDLDAVNMNSGEHFNRVESVTYWNSAVGKITSSSTTTTQSRSQTGTVGPNTSGYPGVAGPSASSGYQPPVQQYQQPVNPAVPQNPAVNPYASVPYSDSYAASIPTGNYSPYGPAITSYGDAETIANRLRASEPVSATSTGASAPATAARPTTSTATAPATTGTATRPATTGTTTAPAATTGTAARPATGTTTAPATTGTATRPATGTTTAPATGTTRTTTPAPSTATKK